MLGNVTTKMIEMHPWEPTLLKISSHRLLVSETVDSKNWLLVVVIYGSIYQNTWHLTRIKQKRSERICKAGLPVMGMLRWSLRKGSLHTLPPIWKNVEETIRARSANDPLDCRWDGVCIPVLQRWLYHVQLVANLEFIFISSPSSSLPLEGKLPLAYWSNSWVWVSLERRKRRQHEKPLLQSRVLFPAGCESQTSAQLTQTSLLLPSRTLFPFPRAVSKKDDRSNKEGPERWLRG